MHSGLSVIVLADKNSGDAENNTVVATADSNENVHVKAVRKSRTFAGRFGKQKITTPQPRILFPGRHIQPSCSLAAGMECAEVAYGLHR